MCGICGTVDFSGRGPDESLMLRMRESLAHRGPDDAGAYADDCCALGHRRLSVIDLSPKGRQPLSNESGSVRVVCNGEIYNFRELRRQLEDAGHHFGSHTDSEILVHGYEQWGMDGMLPRLRGMYAFAVWDRDKKQSWLCRDRLGVKPLFYVEQADGLAFSSEVHALYGQVEVSAGTIDRTSLDYYLSYGYVPPDRTMVTGVSKLPPGHLLRFDSNGSESWRYWDVDVAGDDQGRFSDQVERVDEFLTAAVKRRLESDAPLGSFLSGGIDSALVTAISAQNSANALRTFTAGFEGAPEHLDERPLARLMADKYGTRHDELLVSSADATQLPRLSWIAGEPFSDIGVLPVYEVARAARPQITVAIVGDGGDESFAGYANVHAAHVGGRLRSLAPAFVRKAAERALLSSRLGGALPPAAHRLGTAARYANRTPLGQYQLADSWHPDLKRQLYSDEWTISNETGAGDSVIARLQARSESPTDADLHMFTDLHLRLPGDYLSKMDIASNAVALEARSPFLDHELVEYAATLPASSKMHKWRQKGPLRKLAEKYLPSEYLTEPKRGFSPPLGIWLRDG